MAKPKPLISTDSTQPLDRSFAHFGPLPKPAKSTTSTFISVTINVLLALIIVIVGAAGVKKVKDDRVATAVFVPVKPLPPEPPKPKIVPPKPPPPKIPPPEPPKIKMPDVKIPDPPKPIPVPVAPPKPVPVVVAAPPKAVVTAAAPKVVSVKMPTQAAALANNSPHPAPIALGNMTNPIAKSNLPAVATVNLGNAGAPGMPSANTGRGPVSKVSLGGNGTPGGGMTGNGVVAVKGVTVGGCNGCTGTKPGGNGNVNSVQTVAINHPPPPPPPPTPTATKAAMSKPPSVIYRPEPAYTAEATAMKLTGAVLVKVRVSASGAVTVIGVTSGLGHGLDESALRAAAQMKFKPAIDSNGNPTDWEGSVKITFQMA